MNRRQFVHLTCSACVGIPAGASLLTACQTMHYTTGSLTAEGIVLSPIEFLEGAIYRKYIIVRNEQMEYPICVYRMSPAKYTALLMRCTHQGTELQAGGDSLHCPAHGSEYDQNGKVTQGPAEINLRSFPVVADERRILIQLK